MKTNVAGVTALAVVVLLLVLSGIASAQNGALDGGTVAAPDTEMERLERDVGPIILALNELLPKFRKLVGELQTMSVADKETRCASIGKSGYQALISQIKKDFTELAAILEFAEALAAEGRMVPPVLDSLLKDNAKEDIPDMLQDLNTLQTDLERVSRSCTKAG